MAHYSAACAFSAMLLYQQGSERLRVCARASECERGLSINKNHYCYPKAADTGRRALLSSNLPLPTASLSSFTSVLPSELRILFSSLSLLLFHPFPLLSNSRSFHFSLRLICSRCLCLPAQFSSSGSFSDLHNLMRLSLRAPFTDLPIEGNRV